MPRRYVRMSPRQRRLRYAVRETLATAGAAAVILAWILVDRLGFFGRAPSPDYDKYHGRTCRVVHVVDGDTLDVDIPDESAAKRADRTRVRLWGVDTPETVKPNTPPQHFGRQATEFTRAAALNQPVRLELEPRSTRDKFARLLAYVHLADERMLNRVLVEQGYAYADPRFEHSHKSEFARLQTQARKDRRGLWQDATAQDLPYYLRDKVRLPEKSPDAQPAAGGQPTAAP